MAYDDNGTLRKSGYDPDSCLWSLFPFDPGEHLERGDHALYYLMLGQDEKQNLVKVVVFFAMTKDFS